MVNKKDLVVGKIYAYDMENILDSKTLLVRVINLPSVGTKWLVRVFNVETEEIFFTKENYLTEVAVLIDTVYNEYVSIPASDDRKLKISRCGRIMFAYCNLVNVTSIELKEFAELSDETMIKFDTLCNGFISEKTEANFKENSKDTTSKRETSKNQRIEKSLEERFKKGDICVFDILNETGLGVVLVKIKDISLNFRNPQNPSTPMTMCLVHPADDDLVIFGVSSDYIITIPEFLEAYEFIDKLGYAKITSKMVATKKAIDSLTPVKNTTVPADKITSAKPVNDSPKKIHRVFSEDDEFSVGEYCLYDIFDTENRMSLVRIESFITSSDSFSKKNANKVNQRVVMYDVEWGMNFEGDPTLLTAVSTARHIYATSIEFFGNERLLKRIRPLFQIVDHMLNEESDKPAVKETPSALDLFAQSYELRNKLIRERISNLSKGGAECDKINTATDLSKSWHSTINRLVEMLTKPNLNNGDRELLTKLLEREYVALMTGILKANSGTGNEEPVEYDNSSKQNDCASCKRLSCPKRISLYTPGEKKPFTKPSLEEHDIMSLEKLEWFVQLLNDIFTK